MNVSKIPKVIHYCWFSGEAFTPFIQECIGTWKKVMPDYELRLWNANSFDFNSIPFVKAAFEKRKWAFVADYIRLYAVYTEGGIYLDSDVVVYKSFDSFLNYSFFTSHEFHPGNFTQTEQKKIDKNGINLTNNPIIGLNIQAAIFGAEKGCSFLKDCLDFYNSMESIENINGKEFETLIIGPLISQIAEKYGYRYIPGKQLLANNMIILEPEIFVGNSLFQSSNSYAMHCINGSWREHTRWQKFLFYMRNYHKHIFPIFSFINRIINKINRTFSVIIKSFK